MPTRLTPAPKGYEPVKVAGRWLIVAYATDRKGAITTAQPVIDASVNRPATWSRRKFAIDALTRDLLYKELDRLRALVGDRDATSTANVVAS